jgi:aspartate carbamoyltransferase catalytic subunit
LEEWKAKVLEALGAPDRLLEDAHDMVCEKYLWSRTVPEFLRALGLEVYKGIWTSMGAEAENEKRKIAFLPYQVNKDLLKHARKDCVVMHCLPAVRGEEITADIMEGPQSVIFDEAENRLHIQKAILLHLIR